MDAYRDAIVKAGYQPKKVLFSAPTKKFNRHGKVSAVHVIHIYQNPLLQLK